MCPVQSWVLTSQLVAITCPDSRFYGQVKEQLVNRGRHVSTDSVGQRIEVKFQQRYVTSHRTLTR